MKTVCLLNSATQLTFYDLAALKTEYDLRFVAILPEEQRSTLLQAVADELDAVFWGTTVPVDGIPTMPSHTIPQDCFDLLEREARAGRLAIVSTTNEYAPLAAELRTRFGLPGRTEDNIRDYWNKAHVKCKLAAAGIRVPKGQTVFAEALAQSRETAFDELSGSLGLPFILKPHEAAGCVGVAVIDGPAAMQDWFALDKVTDRFEAEEFIQGRFFHCDSIVQGGEIWNTFCWEYTYPSLTFLSGAPMGSITLTQDSTLRHRLLDFSAAALRALGLVDGSSHMEVFLSDADELIFLEIGPRPPGSPSFESFEETYGIKFTHADLMVSVGLPLPAPPQPKRTSLWAVWPHIEGKVTGFTPPELQNPARFLPLFGVGDDVSASIDIRYQSCQIRTSSTEFDAAYADFEIIRTAPNPLQVAAQ